MLDTRRREIGMRDILVTVCGLTPQVVTETLWALHHRTPPIHPAEIWILTTRSGRAKCLSDLLSSNGALARYVREWRPRPVPRCGPKHVLVLKGATGRLLEDVRSEQDSQAIADQLAEFLRRQTERAHTRLHCSVAGGRKTMGVLLAAALHLYGRPEDRLYHVLVPAAFESLPTFYFPPRRPVVLHGSDGRQVNTRDARVELAELPYVRLRGLLPPAHLREVRRFGEVVEWAQRTLRLWQQPDPVVIVDNRSLRIGAKSVRLTPAQMTLYRALARTKLHHCAHPDLPTCGDCIDCFLPFTKDTWEQTRAILEARGGGSILPSVKGPDDAPEQFRSLVSKLNRQLDNAIGFSGHDNPYRVRAGGQRGETVYGLALDKTKIREGTAPGSG
jgi:CRISPR-associated protein (TIGR02584 family)